MNTDQMNASAMVGAGMTASHGIGEHANAEGHYVTRCYESVTWRDGVDTGRTEDIIEYGELIWEDSFPNTVCTIGKNVMLDAALAGSSYTVTGPYMGLISSTSYSAISAADTMASHAGWLEAGSANTPTYSGTRKICAWSAASAGSKALSAGLAFTATGSGTIKGGFITYGTGAVNTIDSTAGTLFSAGLFSGGDQPVVSTNVVTVSYSVGL